MLPLHHRAERAAFLDATRTIIDMTAAVYGRGIAGLRIAALWSDILRPHRTSPFRRQQARSVDEQQHPV